MTTVIVIAVCIVVPLGLILHGAFRMASMEDNL
jgi:hypothetical protein